MTTTLSTPLTPDPETPAAARKVLGLLARLRHGSLSWKGAGPPHSPERHRRRLELQQAPGSGCLGFEQGTGLLLGWSAGGAAGHPEETAAGQDQEARGGENGQGALHVVAPASLK